MSDHRTTPIGRKPSPKRHGLEKEDYYIDANGFVVFTAAYHLKRGYCCKNGCLHCPYGFRKGEK
ncbi:DUF5522 domain-containing protein [Runella slithyformis]|uniref:DUF5522 domain-containing protein n=1 Tax=Runella slithyformis TaxID=106 RepID=UPI0009D97846|nr:DUF5522 domain-containing protein [Runella slithyformis]